MSPRDLLSLVGGALGAHAVRTRLTLLAVAIGVAAVLVLISLGHNARTYVLEQFGGLGSNLLIVTPGKVETSGGPPLVASGTRELTIEDALAIRHQVPGVVDMAPVSVAALEARSRGRARDAIVVGTTSRFVPVRNLVLAAGRNLPEIDPHDAAAVCLLGRKIARELFPDESPLGKVVRLGDSRLRVIGLIATGGTSLGVDFDELILAPLASVQRMINREGLFRILVQVRSFDAVPAVREAVRTLLRRRHRQEDFTIVTQQAVMESLGDILGILTAALSAIAGISLLVAGIGIMNVMLISVAERTPEI
ncbi:MAG: ABC transporter permease, partial [Planctomycetota bacterium]